MSSRSTNTASRRPCPARVSIRGIDERGPASPPTEARGTGDDDASMPRRARVDVDERASGLEHGVDSLRDPFLSIQWNDCASVATRK